MKKIAKYIIVFIIILSAVRVVCTEPYLVQIQPDGTIVANQNTAINLSVAGVNLITSFEGYRSHAYRCPAGVVTIGYGRTRGVKIGDRTTKAKEKVIFAKEVKRYERIVKRHIHRPMAWYEYDALTSFAYNLGDRIRGKLAKDINQYNTLKTTNRMMRYNKARVRGKLTVLRGLTRRRTVETAFFKFEYSLIKNYIPKNKVQVVRIIEIPPKFYINYSKKEKNI